MTLGPRGPQETAFAPIFEAIHRGLLQRERLLKLDTPLGANALIPLRAVGEAKLGRDYTWTIDVATTRDDLNADALIAQQSSLSEQHRAESLKAGHDALTELTGATRQPVEPGLSGGRTSGGGTGSANGFRVPAMLLGSGRDGPHDASVAARVGGSARERRRGSKRVRRDREVVRDERGREGERVRAGRDQAVREGRDSDRVASRDDRPDRPEDGADRVGDGADRDRGGQGDTDYVGAGVYPPEGR
ncbi:hypothetical protein WS70_21260 [Burkholderia mayonis]|uniref:Uncharacterized protein n=1 Tax=Burkholderia mayonis TaxID=1385591 RepID=A0A1B4FL25_9BURK|nr:hypothetical protein WS70_21260 [Burkholderia mayonis]